MKTRKTKKSVMAVGFTLIIIAVLTFTVIAAERPVVIDFSRDDWVMNDINADAIMDIVNIDGRRVIRVEVINGADLDDPTDNSGDPNATVRYFADDYQLDGDTHQWIRISYMNRSDAPYFEFHFASPTQGMHVSTSFNVDIQPQSAWSYTVAHVPTELERFFPKRPEDVTDPDNFVNHWGGLISGLRLDFMYYEEPGGRAREGDVIYVEYIAFFDTEEAARAFEFTPIRTVEAIEQEAAEREAAREEARLAAEAERLERELELERGREAAEQAAQQGEGEGDEPVLAPGEAGGGTPAPAVADDDDGGFPILPIGIGAAVVVGGVICVAVIAAKKKKG